MKHLSGYLLIALLLVSGVARAEQMVVFGDWEVHYSLIPTEFLTPEIANQYQVIRGRDRALHNISVLDQNDKPVRAGIAGEIRNLLSQKTPLKFCEFQEGGAVYYLATVKHMDRELLRFQITIVPTGDTEKVLSFEQTMYWETR